MVKMLIFMSAILVFLHATPGRASVAEMGRGAVFLISEGNHEEEALRDDCFSLIRIFDQTGTNNAEAVRMRQAAEQNCERASDSDVYRGWELIRQALIMINAY